MTLPVGPTGEQLAVELDAAEILTRALRQQLQTATRQITNLYVRFAGSTSNPLPDRRRRDFADGASQIISRVAIDIRGQLWALVLRALQAGQQSAIPFIFENVVRLRDYSSTAYDEVESLLREAETRAQTTKGWAAFVIAAIQARVSAGLASASGMPQITLPANFEQALAALAPAQTVLVNLERDARWMANAAFNQAAREAADDHGMARMWVAERDACLHCLALSGEIAQPGQPFPSALTFYIGPEGNYKPLPVYPAGPLWGPPRHPNCRCFVRPVPVLQDYPVMPWEQGPYHPSQALKREARRSVLRGQSGSDSRPARLRAVAALLRAGAGLPRSVEARARAAVRAGQFRDNP